MLPKKIATLLGALACGAAVAACGGSAVNARYANNQGIGYVRVGHLNYQVQVSRALNPWDRNEDHWYLQGFSSAQLRLPTGEEWFGVSLQVYNFTSAAHTPTDRFYITDTLGDRFTPITNPNPNPYTYVPAPIPAGGQLPNISSAAFAGWTQGEFIIFKVPYADLVNRPFILHIVNQHSASDHSQIELDV